MEKRRGRLGEELAETLAAAIRGGEIPRGGRLPAERELMRRYAVGRTAVREAIAALAVRGLVRTRPGYRPVVAPPDLTTTMDRIGRMVAHLLDDRAGVLNLFGTRIFVEAALVRHAALHARAEDVAALRAALADNEACIGKWPDFYRTDVAFHGVLYRVPRNPIFPAIHMAYVDWLTAYWQAMPRDARIDEANFRAHRIILEEILARDPDRAEQALRDHLAAAWQIVRPTLLEVVPGNRTGG